MQQWERKFSDTLGMMYNEFCHNLNFKSNSKLKHWLHDGENDYVMVISNNETDVVLDFETGFLTECLESHIFPIQIHDLANNLHFKRFSEIPKEIQFWLGARETKSSTGTKWSPENILVYNSTYYEMLELNSMMTLMQSVTFMLLMLLL